MKFKLWLNESVSFYPKDWEESSFKDLLSLTYHVNDILHKIPGYSNGTSPEKFTTDGDAHFKTSGTLNFYTKGMPETAVKTALQAIPYYLKELGAEVIGTPRKDTSKLFGGEVYRFQARLTATQEDRPPDINMSNVNARVILTELLGILPAREDLAGVFNARELMMKIKGVTDFHQEIPELSPIKQVIKPPTQDGNIHYGGIDQEYIQRALESLEKLAQWAIDHHYDQISFG